MHVHCKAGREFLENIFPHNGRRQRGCRKDSVSNCRSPSLTIASEVATTNFCISTYPFYHILRCLYFNYSAATDLDSGSRSVGLKFKPSESSRHGIYHHGEYARNCNVHEMGRNATGGPLQNHQASFWNGEGTCTLQVFGLWKSLYAWLRASWISPLSTSSRLGSCRVLHWTILQCICLGRWLHSRAPIRGTCRPMWAVSSFDWDKYLTTRRVLPSLRSLSLSGN